MANPTIVTTAPDRVELTPPTMSKSPPKNAPALPVSSAIPYERSPPPAMVPTTPLPIIINPVRSVRSFPGPDFPGIVCVVEPCDKTISFVVVVSFFSRRCLASLIKNVLDNNKDNKSVFMVFIFFKSNVLGGVCPLIYDSKWLDVIG